jgi:hypothetical protein
MERDYKEDLDVSCRVILKWIVECLDGTMWNGSKWLKFGVDSSYHYGYEQILKRSDYSVKH